MNKNKITISEQLELIPAQEKEQLKQYKEQSAQAVEKQSTTKTLDEIWGIRDARYSHKTIEDYTRFIKSMTPTDMRFHCREIGMPYYEDWSLNIEKLTQEYNKHKFTLRIYPNPNLN